MEKLALPELLVLEFKVPQDRGVPSELLAPLELLVLEFRVLQDHRALQDLLAPLVLLVLDFKVLQDRGVLLELLDPRALLEPLVLVLRGPLVRLGIEVYEVLLELQEVQDVLVRREKPEPRVRLESMV